MDITVSDCIHKSFSKTRMKRAFWDKAMVFILSLFAISVLTALFAILLYLIVQGWSSLNLDFFTHLPKPVGEKGGGMANGIVGTFILLGIALCVGLPLGMGTGIYLSEYAGNKFASLVRFTTDVINGIPSIVYGIFAYTILVRPLKSFSAISGGFALGIMMIPMIARTTENFLNMVPQSLRSAGLALGAPKWKVVLGVVLPCAFGGIVTGVMVALARVAGETAPLLFTAFGNQYWQSSLMHPIAAMPLQIFNYSISPFEDWHRQAWGGALVLITLVFLINIIARAFVERQNKVSAIK